MSHYNATQVSVHLKSGGLDGSKFIWVEESFAIEYTQQQSDMPIYGWNNTYFDRIAPGKAIVKGALIINSSTPYYMKSILLGKKFRPKITQDEENYIEHTLTQINSQIRIMKDNSRLGIGVSGGRMLELARIKAALVSGSSRRYESGSTDDMDLKPGFDPFSVDGHQIKIEPNPEMAGRIPTIYLYDVKFNSKSSAVQIETANNIKEAYTFIARKVDEVHDDRQLVSFRDADSAPFSGVTNIA